jgi:hypothetical protein
LKRRYERFRNMGPYLEATADDAEPAAST